MKIDRGGSQPSIRGPPELFTGTVWVDYLHTPADPARAQVQHVTFEPGSRTVWHTHPLGQVLIVVSGAGWVQREGGPVEEIRAGDVISIAPGEKHWHGATRAHVMSFIAVQEELNGRVVEALGAVSDKEYRPPPRVGPSDPGAP